MHSPTNPDLGCEVIGVFEVLGHLANFLVSSVDVGVISSSRISSAVICERSKVRPVEVVEKHTIPRGSTSGR